MIDHRPASPSDRRPPRHWRPGIPLLVAAVLTTSLVTAPTAHADGDLELRCELGDRFHALLPGSTDEYVGYRAVGSNGAVLDGSTLWLDADPETGVGDRYVGHLGLMRSNGLTPPYVVEVTDLETGATLAEGTLGECDGAAPGAMTPPYFPAAEDGRWQTTLPSNDFMGWRHETDGSLTAVAKDGWIWAIGTYHPDYQRPNPAEVSLGMPPGSEEQVRFDVFLCSGWGGDAEGFHVWSSGPGVGDHVTLQYANRNVGWVDVAGEWPIPEDYVWPAQRLPWRYALSGASGLRWSDLEPNQGPVSLRALDPDGRVVGQRTYDSFCGTTFDPATYTVVDVPEATVTTDGTWVVPDSDATYQWTLEVDGELVVRVLPLLTTFPDGGITHNYGVAGDVTEPTPAPEVGRTAGTNRFDTAARLATEHYAPGLETVYLATGRAFPDALAGAALAGHVGAPVLLTDTGSLPSETQAALEVLDPGRVVVLGGKSAISEAVMDSVSALGFEVTRLAGSDRYATAALVSAELPASGSVYVASGLNYPDALAAAAAAGADGAPVLLVKQGTIPPVTLEELARRDSQVVYVLGGTAAVSTAVQDQLDALGYQTERVGGKDRYATAAAVASLSGVEFPQAWVAAGTGFADALAAAPLAGREGGPILLTHPKTLPPSTSSALLAGKPDAVTVLGGKAAVSTEVEQQIADLPWVQ